MPSQIFDLLPYKETHEALKNADHNKMKELLCGFVVNIALGLWESTWDSLSDKNEKKMHLKALVYLDALISLYRMPPSFDRSMAELIQLFRGISIEPLDKILDKFCTRAVVEQGDDRRNKATKFSNQSEVQFKLMKSKEQIKVLILHIIGLVVNLSSTNSAKLSFLSRILKKEEKDLKNYCVELGLKLEPCKTRDRDTDKEFDDFVARLKYHSGGRSSAKKED